MKVEKSTKIAFSEEDDTHFLLSLPKIDYLTFSVSAGKGLEAIDIRIKILLDGLTENHACRQSGLYSTLAICIQRMLREYCARHRCSIHEAVAALGLEWSLVDHLRGGRGSRSAPAWTPNGWIAEGRPTSERDLAAAYFKAMASGLTAQGLDAVVALTPMLAQLGLAELVFPPSPPK